MQLGGRNERPEGARVSERSERVSLHLHLYLYLHLHRCACIVSSLRHCLHCTRTRRVRGCFRAFSLYSVYTRYFVALICFLRCFELRTCVIGRRTARIAPLSVSLFSFCVGGACLLGVWGIIVVSRVVVA